MKPKEVPSSPSPGVKKLVGSALKHLRLATIDNFQGEEADVVIVSTVRCNSNGRIGFLRFDNRVNVMFSRAKHGMYVFGSKATVEKYEKKPTAIQSSALPLFWYCWLLRKSKVD